MATFHKVEYANQWIMANSQKAFTQSERKRRARKTANRSRSINRKKEN